MIGANDRRHQYNKDRNSNPYNDTVVPESVCRSLLFLFYRFPNVSTRDESARDASAHVASAHDARAHIFEILKTCVLTKN